MKNPRAKVLSALAALCGSLGLGLIAHSTPAAAVPITIGGCSAASGSEDTAAIPPLTLDDSVFAGGALIPLHDRVGSVGGFYNGNQYNPAAPDNAMSTPVCGVQRSAAGVLSYTWLYCTEKPLNACGNAPWFMTGGAAATVLTTLEKARMAWILDNVVTQPVAGGGTTEASNRTQATRAQRQRLIWCVSERLGANVAAPDYLAPFEAALTCPNWPAIDPQLNLNPQLSITAAPVSAARRIVGRTQERRAGRGQWRMTGGCVLPAGCCGIDGGQLAFADHAGKDPREQHCEPPFSWETPAGWHISTNLP